MYARAALVVVVALGTVFLMFFTGIATAVTGPVDHSVGATQLK